MSTLTLVDELIVTPYAGVWIEIENIIGVGVIDLVTPYAGVWIEIVFTMIQALDTSSHSLRGSVD